MSSVVALCVVPIMITAVSLFLHSSSPCGVKITEQGDKKKHPSSPMSRVNLRSEVPKCKKQGQDNMNSYNLWGRKFEKKKPQLISKSIPPQQ